MTRVLFTLSMPGRASWNGRWSGEDKNYAIVRTLSNNDGKIYAAHERPGEAASS